MTIPISCRAREPARLPTYPLADYLNELAAWLREQGYAPDTRRHYLSAAVAFSRWLAEQGLTVVEVSEAVLERYWASLGRCSSPTTGRDRLPAQAIGLSHWMNLLRRHGVLQAPPEAPPTEAERWLHGYSHYLESVRGAAATTRQKYLYFARQFLHAVFGAHAPDWAWVDADTVAAFVRKEAARRRGFGRKAPATALRVLLRYLIAQGHLPAGIEAAVPRVRQYRLAALPRALSADEIARLIHVAADGTPQGWRNRAILLVLARLGLRAHEVARLRLGDIDWAQGELHIRAGKSHRERCLPLPQDVGEALVAYLQHGRPRQPHRQLFLRATAPFTALQTASAVTHIVQRTLARAGIALQGGGAHLLRHAAATRMVCQGASFKEVADVLGHQSLTTTALYAKLDLPALAFIPLPWPGGAP
jgi:integrase/recombinase XerD